MCLSPNSGLIRAKIPKIAVSAWKYPKNGKMVGGSYSVLKELPHEHDLVTFGLLILNPEPIRLSM